MSSFHSLHLREPTDRKEKSQTQRQQNRQRQKAYLKDLLVSNILKKFGSHAVSQQAVAGNFYLQTLVSQEVDEFLNNEVLTQKSLNSLEKRLSEKLIADDRIKDLFSEERLKMGFQRKEKPDVRNDIRNSNEQHSWQLPNINKSVTPRKKNESQIQAYKKKHLSQLRTSQNHQQQVRSSLQYGYGKMNNNSLSHNKPGQQSLQVLAYDKQAPHTLLSSRMDFTYGGNKDLMTERQRYKEPVNEPSQSLADLKVKLGQRRRLSGGSKNGDADSRPSDISEDEWAEIVKYNKEKYEEDKLNEKRNQAMKKEAVRKTLEKQLQEKRKQKRQEIEEKQQFEQNLLQSLKEKEKVEKLKEQEFKQKVMQQKALRDVQLKESKQKREQDYVKQREQELEFMNKLKQEINEERQSIIEKKRKEREVCQKIIHENEVYKQKQLIQKEEEKQKEIRLREEYERHLEEQDRKRQEEWNQREARIQSLVNKMADTVVKKNNEMEKEVERKVMQYQQEKEDKDARKEQLQKQNLKKRYEDIQRSLQMQIQEKKQQREQENLANEIFIKKQINRDEEAKKQIHEEQQNKRQKELELQEFLKRQMDDSKIGGDSVSVISKRKQGAHGGHQMNTEEYRMNKQLLKEISKKKKEKMGISRDKSREHSYIGDSVQKAHAEVLL